MRSLGRPEGYEPQPVAQMARDMGLARQSVQRVADVLEKQGLVTYKDNPTDRRAQLVELTGQGRKTLAAIYRRNAEWSDRMGAKLDLRRLAKVTAELERINGTVDGYAFQATFLPMGDGHLLAEARFFLFQ